MHIQIFGDTKGGYLLNSFLGGYNQECDASQNIEVVQQRLGPLNYSRFGCEVESLILKKWFNEGLQRSIDVHANKSLRRIRMHIQIISSQAKKLEALLSKTH